MQRMFKVCAGMDVHKDSVFVCLVKPQPDASLAREVRRFGTTTRCLLELLDWLTRERCESAAMESTGVYWKPVFNILEASVPVVLVNAQHVKGLPGRKTDVQDCEWIAAGHSLFERCVILARRGTQYHELGGTYFDERKKEAVTRRLTRRLESLGFKVTLEARAA